MPLKASKRHTADKKADFTHSPLLALPPEIRNMIYQYVFETFQMRPMLVGACRYATNFNEPSIHRSALIRTCRQIRQETLAMFYNSVVFFPCMLCSPTIRHWLFAVPQEIKRAHQSAFEYFKGRYGQYL